MRQLHNSFNAKTKSVFGLFVLAGCEKSKEFILKVVEHTIGI